MEKGNVQKHFAAIEQLARIGKEAIDNPKLWYQIGRLIAGHYTYIDDVLCQYEFSELGFIGDHCKMLTEEEVLTNAR